VNEEALAHWGLLCQKQTNVVDAHYLISMLFEKCMLPLIQNIIIHKTNFNFFLSAGGTS
jgi:hypothetical protein